MHTYVRLRGHGLLVLPYAPFLVRRIGDGVDDRIAVEHDGRRVIIDPRERASGFEGVADVTEVPSDARWTVELGAWRLSWPNHFALASSDLDGIPFELWGADGAEIHVQGPFAPQPALDDLVLPGQDRTGDGRGPAGARWVEVAYVHDDLRWTQRHYLLLGGLVVTVQAPAQDAAPSITAGERLVGELSG